jgi:hypothetical protein
VPVRRPAPRAPNGLFDVNIQSSGSSATLAFDKTQSVSSSPALFNSQTVTVADDSGYQVTLTDLKFPTAFDSLALVVSRGSQVVGKVFGGGTFTFTATPGDYQLTFVASPSADQLFGLYAAAMAYAPPSVTLSASASSVASGSNVTSDVDCGQCDQLRGQRRKLEWERRRHRRYRVGARGCHRDLHLDLHGSRWNRVSDGDGHGDATTTSSGSKSGGGALDPLWLVLGSSLVLVRLGGTVATRRRKMAAR